MSQILPRTAPPDCPLCGGPCKEPFERGWYVFPNRRPDPPPPVIAVPHRVVVDERVKYAPGDPIPWDEAVSLGLVEGAPPPEPPKPKRGTRKKVPAKKAGAKKRARKPAEDRARKLKEDRSK